MVIYYSLSSHTKTAAEELAKLLACPLGEIRDAKPREGFAGIAAGAAFAFFKKPSEILPTPDLKNAAEITICSPVWAGQINPAVRRFIKIADLSGKTVNILLTCAAYERHGRYKISAIEALAGKGAKLGFAIVLAAPKGGSEREVIREHLEEMIPVDTRN
jgi:flavodoxin